MTYFSFRSESFKKKGLDTSDIIFDVANSQTNLNFFAVSGKKTWNLR